MKKSFTVLLGVVFLAGCGQQETNQMQEAQKQTTNEQVDNTSASKETNEQIFSNQESDRNWQTYTNEKLGFSISVPKKVLSDFNNEKSWSNLNIFETDNSVIFTTNKTKDEYWNFKIGGTTVKNRDEIVPFLESYYGIKGCTVEFNKIEEKDGLFYLPIYPKNSNLLPDDPESCFIGGKTSIIYDENSGKIITYRLIEEFFFIPGGSLGDEALESLKFPI
jgi:hypothetical protein